MMAIMQQEELVGLNSKHLPRENTYLVNVHLPLLAILTASNLTVFFLKFYIEGIPERHSCLFIYILDEWGGGGEGVSS